MPVSDLAFNIWGVVSSVLGTIALTPVFLGWLKPRLPTSMIADVLDIYKETQDLFATALRDGLITNPDEMNHFKANLLDATISVDRLRAEVYLIETWRQDLSKWWRGLSGRIWILRENLNSVRAELAQRSSNERLKLAAQIRKSETSSGLEDSGMILNYVKPSTTLIFPQAWHPQEPHAERSTWILLLASLRLLYMDFLPTILISSHALEARNVFALSTIRGCVHPCHHIHTIIGRNTSIIPRPLVTTIHRWVAQATLIVTLVDHIVTLVRLLRPLGLSTRRQICRVCSLSSFPVLVDGLAHRRLAHELGKPTCALADSPAGPSLRVPKGPVRRLPHRMRCILICGSSCGWCDVPMV
ncbi:hypothetical protein PYCCODRAFT_560466 [Trametes coccinea BRFM310]|uniref:Uncharacterized protein n=1 Tax=Trametes coccinea (strain BRFM310) TaxID=1353009 RepID=A0A1Y2IIP8_TRAC3|nr:hypothetical protein PYCCODRAFT_560466 [Trametes coccinea BRFM310]